MERKQLVATVILALLVSSAALTLNSAFAQAAPPAVETGDKDGNIVDAFYCEVDKEGNCPGVDIYVFGENFEREIEITIYIFGDATWKDGSKIDTALVVTMVTLKTDSSGGFKPIAIHVDKHGCYDVLIDVDRNGEYNVEKDALDDNDIACEVKPPTAGFCVFCLPEYTWGALGSAGACACGFVIFKRRKSVN